LLYRGDKKGGRFAAFFCFFGAKNDECVKVQNGCFGWFFLCFQMLRKRKQNSHKKKKLFVFWTVKTDGFLKKRGIFGRKTIKSVLRSSSGERTFAKKA